MSIILPTFVPKARPHRPEAFALVVVLLVLGMLAVVAVGFLSSMSTERTTAAAFSSKAKAEQAAQAGVDNAIAVLQQGFRDYPDSATMWETQSVTKDGTSTSASSANNEGTSLYVRAVPTGDGSQPDPTKDNRPLNIGLNAPKQQIFVLPLVSGAKFAPIASKANAINTGKGLSTLDDMSVDINARRSAKDTQGFIGSPLDPSGTAPTAPKPFRVPWVEIKEQTTADPKLALKTIARYAFWVEDESFKTNINYAGIGDASTSAPPFARRDNNKNTPPGPTDVGLFGALNVFKGLQPPFLVDQATQNVFKLRNLYPGLLFPEPRAYMQVPDTTHQFSDGTTLGDRLRFLTTTQSGALNLSRNGGQRLNLNALIPSTTSTPTQIQTQVDKLVSTIIHNLPKFGQRFYRNSTAGDANTLNADNIVSSNYAGIYPYKVAANIRDYLDPDSQPTMVKNNGRVPDPSNAADAAIFFPPSFPWGTDGKGGDGTNLLWAQGKERTPYLQETVMRFRPMITPGAAGGGSTFTIRVDYYMEFWNMSNRDISASEMGGAFVHVSSQMGWLAAQQVGNSSTNFTRGPELYGGQGGYITDGDGIGLSQNEAPQRDYDISLVSGVYQASGLNATPQAVPGVVFKAGACTVITTDPDFSQDQASDSTRTYFPKSIYYYNGNRPVGGLNYATTYYCSTLVGRPNPTGGKRIFHGKMPAGNNSIGPILRDSSSGGTPNVEDYETEILMGNQQGYFDCAISTMPVGGGTVFTYTPNWVQDRFHDYLNGGSLVGNGNTPSETGDPRTNNEQLQFKHFVQGGSIGQPDQSRYFNPGSGDNPAFTLGTPNSLYLQPGIVSSTFPNNSGKAYMPWKDYYDFPTSTYPTANPTADNAPAVIADGPLASIGELGDVYDPARVLGTVGTAAGTKLIEYSRGGGRTFKIGQHDDLTDPTPGSVSNAWAAWRLTDIFSAGPVDTLADDLYLPGRINLNGIARDNGAALQAALQGFVYQPITSAASSTAAGSDAYRVHGDLHKAYAPAGKPIPAAGVQKLVTELKNRFQNTNYSPAAFSSTNGPNTVTYGPLFERGEFSELDILGKNITTYQNDNYPAQANVDLIGGGDNTVGGDLNRAFDHTREELFRRLAEMTCTRGNVFTAYAVGQALTQTDPTKPKYAVNSTSQMRVTFQLNPVWKDPKTNKDARNADSSPRSPALTDFNPGLPTVTPDDSSKQTVAQRFAKPDHYEIQVLHVNTY